MSTVPTLKRTGECDDFVMCHVGLAELYSPEFPSLYISSEVLGEIWKGGGGEVVIRVHLSRCDKMSQTG